MAMCWFEACLSWLYGPTYGCRGVFAHHSKFCEKTEFLPRCCPALPDEVLAASPIVESMVYYIASSVGMTDQFVFPQMSHKRSGGLVKSSVESIIEDFNNHGLCS